MRVKCLGLTVRAPADTLVLPSIYPERKEVSTRTGKWFECEYCMRSVRLNVEDCGMTRILACWFANSGSSVGEIGCD